MDTDKLYRFCYEYGLSEYDKAVEILKAEGLDKALEYLEQFIYSNHE